MKYFEEASNRLRYTSDEVVTIPVDHPGEASACKIVIDGFTFVYSGDTMYSKDLATLAKDADLIVHECTFENDQKENAKEKRHSTLGDALRVFRESNPKRMILTHFSQRYHLFHPESVSVACEKETYRVIPIHDGVSIPVTDTDFKRFGELMKECESVLIETHKMSKSYPVLQCK
jgi:ribonuclease BN (tRNA processing enzyme)